MVRNHIIVGLGYGDEGKGVFTDFLASMLDNALVIRYNGGHQCGHTVHLPDGRSHVFSNFGAGTFRDVPTFISRYCTVDPVGIVSENAALQAMGIAPILLIDPMAMVVTPFDKFFNVNNPENVRHGTVGVGFGACVERNYGPCKLLVQDLFYTSVLRHKLEAIREYYRGRFKTMAADNGLAGLEFETLKMDSFHEAVKAAREYIHLITERQMFAGRFENFIFEGAQGILLDQQFGVFPNMTRSFTTSRNAFEMILRNHPESNSDVYYLTRAYQTRHGNGWMSSENHPVTLTNTELETNRSDGFQGTFRTGLLDTDLLRYAYHCDASFAFGADKHMVVSCLDQLTSYNYLRNGRPEHVKDEESFLKQIAICDAVFVNNSPTSGTIRRW